MERMLGVDVTDPAASATFGAVAGAKGKIAPALIAAMGASSGDAEAGGLQKMLQMVYRGHNGAPNPEKIFATPQREVAEYYAQKRAMERGGSPSVESLLVDPFAGRRYGHSIPMDNLNRDVRMTQAVELRPEDVLQRYAKGAFEGYAAGGLVSDELGPSVSDEMVSGLLDRVAMKYQQFAQQRV